MARITTEFTRTVHTTTALVMVVNTTTQQVENKNYVLLGELDKKQVENIVKKQLENGLVFVQVMELNVIDKMYSISIEDFIKYGKEITK